MRPPARPRVREAGGKSRPVTQPAVEARMAPPPPGMDDGGGYPPIAQPPPSLRPQQSPLDASTARMAALEAPKLTGERDKDFDSGIAGAGREKTGAKLGSRGQ